MNIYEPAVAASEIPVILSKGAGEDPSRDQADLLQAAFRDAGLKPDFWAFAPGEDLRAVARRAMQSRPAVLVAAGGDGTVGGVADVVRGTGTALGVMPVGTLNHFAKDLGIPLDMAEAARVIAAGRRVRVDVGEVNGRAFVNNVSLGLYADLVRKRKRQQRRLRRSKRMAMLWASLEVLGRSRLLDVRLEVEGRAQQFRVPFVFVGNNDYTMEGFHIGTRARLDGAVLDVYSTRRTTAPGLIALALRALFGRLRQGEDFMEWTVRGLRVDSRRRRLVIAADGELTALEAPFEMRVLPRALEVIVP